MLIEVNVGVQVTDVFSAEYIKVVPVEHRGVGELCPLMRNPVRCAPTQRCGRPLCERVRLSTCTYRWAVRAYTCTLLLLFAYAYACILACTCACACVGRG
jgi:hypothetical protein